MQRGRREADDGLRGLIHRSVPRVHWQPIEVGLLTAGVPDSNGCGENEDGIGTDFWVECKATDGWAVGLDPFQVGWIMTRMRHGGRVFVATRRRHDGGVRRGPPVDELWLHEGHDAALLKAEGLSGGAPPILVEVGGPTRWDWGRVRHVLLNWEFGRG